MRLVWVVRDLDETELLDHSAPASNVFALQLFFRQHFFEMRRADVCLAAVVSSRPLDKCLMCDSGKEARICVR